MTASDRLDTFERHRPALRALAYRMLGDMGRAEDIVQDAWLRWSTTAVEADAPKAFLLKIVTRLCLNEMQSARARREESRSDRLPEPIAIDGGASQVEMADRISMAFLVLLQRLTPAERATLVLHDVFDLEHREIAALLGNSEAASRQLLSRARTHVAEERRSFEASQEEHRRLLRAFVAASSRGDQEQMLQLLADEATLVVDVGPDGKRVGRIRNAGRPITGAKRIAAFLAAVARESTASPGVRECELNGQPAIVRLSDGKPIAAVMLSVVGGRIRQVFVQADPRRLSHLGALD